MYYDHRNMTMVETIMHETIAAGEFKAKCLKIMDTVKKYHSQITITKHGKPIAKLVPIISEPIDVFGCMKGTVSIKGDIISPIDVTWNANE